MREILLEKEIDVIYNIQLKYSTFSPFEKRSKLDDCSLVISTEVYPTITTCHFL